MWIVKLAIDRPYTFIVVSMLLAFISTLTAWHMAVDIFPNINIPVVSVIWGFTGLSPEEMEARIVSVSERAMTMVTSDIEHMESVSLSGIGIIRVYLHQGANVGKAVALMSSINQDELINMPPGITPPAVVAFSATDVPVLQLGVSSKVLTEAQLYDYDLNFIRTRLATVGGASLPLPYGGKQRDVMVDLYPDRLLAKGVSANDVVTALGQQNIILPAGIARFGKQEFPVRINGSPELLEEFNSLPVKQINNATVYIRDVGHAHDGYTIQTNIVRLDGKRATLLNVLRSGGASTLNVVRGIKETLPAVMATLPSSLDLKIVNDQSQFVRGAITQVVDEAVVAAFLTGLLMLALLGSWRSTLIVAISIPLSIMTSIIGLGAVGQTLNTMTLGGLSLAVGMLVDDATVEVENIHRNLDLKLPLREAVLTSAAQVALPALVSTVSICIVFLPVVLLTEPSRSLFVPLGMAVVFAMLASYFLSRTLVPVLSMYLLKKEELPGAAVPEGMTPEEAARGQCKRLGRDVEASCDEIGSELPKEPPPQDGGKRPCAGRTVHPLFARIDRHFDRMRTRYHALLKSSLCNPGVTVIGFALFYVLSFCLLPFIGQDFFPGVDAGQMRLHLVVPIGTRVEVTSLYFSQVEKAIRHIIPANEMASVTLNVGTPASGLSLCYGDNTNYTESDGEMLITLNPKHHGSTFQYQKRIREMLEQQFPMITYYFQPADITTQILNAGLQAPIDIQVTGIGNREENYNLAMAIRHEVRLIPGAVDVLVRQALHQRQFNIDVDRTKAVQLGLSQQDVSASVLTSLSSSFQTSPSFWVNPKNGVNYTVAVQTPLYRTRTVDDVTRTLITGRSQLLAVVSQAGGAGRSAPVQGLASNGSGASPQPLALSQSTPAPQSTTANLSSPSILTSPSALIAAPSRTLLTPATANQATPATAALSASTLSPFPTTTAVTVYTTPSNSSIPPYLTTGPQSDSSVNLTSTAPSAPMTQPRSSLPTTVGPSPSERVTQLTTPSTITARETTPVAVYTNPSFLNVPGYANTFSSPRSVAISDGSSVLAPMFQVTYGGQTTSSGSLAPPARPSGQIPITGSPASSLAATSPQAATSTQPAISAPVVYSSQGSTASLQGSLTRAGISRSSAAANSVPASRQQPGSFSSPIGTTFNGSSVTNGLGVFTPAIPIPGVPSLLTNMASTRHSPTSAMVSHYAIQPVFDVYANTQDRDLGGVAHDVQRVIDRYKKSAPRGTQIYMRGQADSMNKAFSGLIVGIIFALVLIYLLLVMNFQSWLDPFIILMAIPGALSGIIWALFITQTTFSVPALMGTIMSIGVGAANSILMVSFANEQMHEGASVLKATWRAGYIRFRPVLMTAMAMIIGMLPMATGLGEGGGQNAPLGRAVIGGLLVATFSTLFFVPVVYSIMKRARNK